MKEQFFLSCSKPHFNLRCPKGDRPTMVYLIIKIKKQYKVSLGLRVIPSQWHKKEGRAMVSAILSELDNRNNQKLNLKILDYTNKYFSLIQYLCNHIEEIEAPDKAIRDIFEMKDNSKKEKIRAILTKALLSRNMKESSFAIYHTKIKEFCDWQEKNYPSLSINEVNLKVMKEYMTFLHQQKVTHKILGTQVYVEDNTVQDKIQIMFTVFGYADIELDFIKKLKKDFENSKTYENQVFLDDSEIELIKGVKFNNKLDEVKDLFLFQLSIAQRWSDVEKICGIDLRDSIRDNKITTRQKKTNTLVTYPLDDTATSILEKYNYILPKIRSSFMNEKLKEICKKVGINTPCECYESRNRKPFTYSVEKWQLVSTHTARRSFISNAIKDGMSDSLIKRISGHKSDSAFNRYNRINSEDAANVYLEMKNKKNNIEVIETKNVVEDKNDIAELQKVLLFFGCDPMEVLDITDNNDLIRLVIHQEDVILEKIGEDDYHILKEVFNDSSLSFKEKANKLKSMMK